MKKSIHVISFFAAALLLALPVMASPTGAASEGLANAEAKSDGRFQADRLPALQNAIDAQERHTDALMNKPGVHGTSVSWTEDGSPFVKVYVDVSASSAGIPESVDGVPVVVVHAGRFFALNVDCEGRGLKNCDGNQAEASAAEQPASPRDWHPRPVPIGISAGHVDVTAGTIACRVSRGCHKYALSNAHVFANENAGEVGDHILQPGPIDGGIDPDDVIGTLYESVPIIMSTSPSVNNRVDAAIIATDASLVGTATRTPSYGSPRSVTAAPQLDLNVQKFGRTSWATKGSISGINGTFNVGYTSGTARFVGQIVIIPAEGKTSFSKPGDSGALIVVDGGTDDRKPVGLLFASANDNSFTLANPIDEVLAALDVTIDGD
jgi:hypothetical protein